MSGFITLWSKIIRFKVRPHPTNNEMIAKQPNQLIAAVLQAAVYKLMIEHKSLSSLYISRFLPKKVKKSETIFVKWNDNIGFQKWRVENQKVQISTYTNVVTESCDNKIRKIIKTCLLASSLKVKVSQCWRLCACVCLDTLKCYNSLLPRDH